MTRSAGGTSRPEPRAPAAIALGAVVLIAAAGAIAGLGGAIGMLSIAIGAAILCRQRRLEPAHARYRAVLLETAGDRVPGILLAIDHPEVLARLQSAGWSRVEPPVQTMSAAAATAALVLRGDVAEIGVDATSRGLSARRLEPAPAGWTTEIAQRGIVTLFAYDARASFDDALHSRQVMSAVAVVSSGLPAS